MRLQLIIFKKEPLSSLSSIKLEVIRKNRGGVEDTRLDAKAKDTKKTRPRPRTAFPRTGTLEAKDRSARGQGQGPRTQAQVLSKKKKKRFSRLHKNFSSDLPKKTFSKKFSSASQNFYNSKNTAVLEPRTGQFSRT